MFLRKWVIRWMPAWLIFFSSFVPFWSDLLQIPVSMCGELLRFWHLIRLFPQTLCVCDFQLDCTWKMRLMTTSKAWRDQWERENSWCQRYYLNFKVYQVFFQTLFSLIVQVSLCEFQGDKNKSLSVWACIEMKITSKGSSKEKLWNKIGFRQ